MAQNVKQRSDAGAHPGKSGKPDKRELIADILLAGGDEADIEAGLVAAGISPAAAKYEASRAGKDPIFQAAKTLANRVAKRDWTLDIYARLQAMDPAARSIPTVDGIEPERFFRDYYFANRPVRLTGLADHWPALEKWTLDYLEQKVGSAIVELQAGRDAATDYEQAKDRHKKRARMADVVGFLKREQPSNDFYLTAYNTDTNSAALAPLWEDLAPVSILKASGGRDGFFWMGPKGTVTPFHHDLTNNLLVQVAGRKQVKMVASHQVARMRNGSHCFSDWTGEELETGPATGNRPEVLECTIGPGEAIFLPIGWWHHVVALDMSISMSFTNFDADNDFYSNYLKRLDF